MKRLLYYSTRAFLWLLLYTFVTMLVADVLESGGSRSVLQWAVFLSLWTVFFMCVFVMVLGYRCLSKRVLFSNGELLVFLFAHIVFGFMGIVILASKGFAGRWF
jgi:hypothetical protein